MARRGSGCGLEISSEWGNECGFDGGEGGMGVVWRGTGLDYGQGK